MNYDPEEEWSDPDLLSRRPEPETRLSLDSAETKWIKKPDGTWKKVPVNPGVKPIGAESTAHQDSPNQAKTSSDRSSLKSTINTKEVGFMD